MELVAVGTTTSFEATFIDPGLFVQAWIYDMTSGSPIGPVKVTMTELTPGTYYGFFTPLLQSDYLIIKRVFTDGTFTVVDSNYSPASESAQGESFSSNGSACGLTVVLSSAQLNVILDESELMTELDESELDVGISEDFLTVVFPCEG